MAKNVCNAITSAGKIKLNVTFFDMTIKLSNYFHERVRSRLFYLVKWQCQNSMFQHWKYFHIMTIHQHQQNFIIHNSFRTTV